MLSARLLKELQKELVAAHRKVHLHRWKNDLEKRKARLTYEKLQLIKARKPTVEVQKELEQLEAGKASFPELASDRAQELVDSEDTRNLSNVVAFLKNQRIYNELLERYNPGLTMSQLENVRKTANMVGLAVPEK